MEDFDLITRVRSYAIENNMRIDVLHVPLVSSGRRQYVNGVINNSLLNWMFVTRYTWLRMSPDDIFKYYYGK